MDEQTVVKLSKQTAEAVADAIGDALTVVGEGYEVEGVEIDTNADSAVWPGGISVQPILARTVRNTGSK